MMIEEGLTLFLKQNVVSVKQRVDPIRLEGTILPALTTQLIDAPRTLYHGGPDRLVTARIQIDCIARYYGTAKLTAKEVIGSLHGYRGLMGTVVVDKTKCEAQSDDYRPDTERFVCIVDALITHREEVA
jgi:hypothetical protein